MGNNQQDRQTTTFNFNRGSKIRGRETKTLPWYLVLPIQVHVLISTLTEKPIIETFTYFGKDRKIETDISKVYEKHVPSYLYLYFNIETYNRDINLLGQRE